MAAQSHSYLALIIDDEAELADYIAEVATLAGFTACPLTSACALLEELPQLQPMLIITDICMPEMDGVELIEALARSGCTTPLVLVSGYGEKYLSITANLATCLGLEVVAMVEKPLRLEYLQSLLHDLREQLGGERGRD